MIIGMLMKNKWLILDLAIVFCLVFVLTLFFEKFYFRGDYSVYKRIYDYFYLVLQVDSFDFTVRLGYTYDYLSGNLAAVFPDFWNYLFFSSAYLGFSFFELNLALNFIFIGLVFYISLNRQAKPLHLLFWILLLASLYVLVLLGPAFRLKVAIIFLLSALTISQHAILGSLVLVVLATVAHLSAPLFVMVFFAISLVSGGISLDRFSKANSLATWLIFVCLLLVVTQIFGNEIAIFQKVKAHFGNSNIIDGLKGLIFSIYVLWVLAPDRSKVKFALILVLLSVSLCIAFGSSRILMIVGLVTVIEYIRRPNREVLPIAVGGSYFLIKGFIFLMNIIEFGHGFP